MRGGSGTALVGLLDEAQDLAEAYGRDDFVAVLARLRQSLEGGPVRVLVAGDFKEGKSALVNALVGEDICPVDDERSTGMVTEVVAGSRPPVIVTGDDKRDISPSQVHDVITAMDEEGTPWWTRRVVVAAPSADATLPALVDLPGHQGAAGGPVLQAALPGVVGVLYVSDAGAEVTRMDMASLEALAAAAVPTALVVPKIDFYPAWRKVCDLDRGHLARRHIEFPVIPVSSLLAGLARTSGDGEMAAESGLDDLRGWLRSVSARNDGDDLTSLVDELRVVLSGLAAAVGEAEATAEGETQALAELEERAVRLHALAGERARWRRVLADGVADLGPEGEHVLRTRLRAVRRDADAAVAHGVPAGGWSRFSFWLVQRTTGDVAAAFAELDAHAAAVSAEVGAAFEDEEAAAVELAPLRPPALDPSDLLDTAAELESSDQSDDRRKVRMRKSLSKVDGAGLLEGLALISLNPLSLAAGVAASRRAIVTGRAQHVEAQRDAALDAVHHHLDEADYVARREWTAALRRIERELRDGYEELASTLARSADEAVAARRRVVDDPAERDRLVHDRGRLARLDEEAVALAARARRSDDD